MEMRKKLWELYDKSFYRKDANKILTCLLLVASTPVLAVGATYFSGSNTTHKYSQKNNTNDTIITKNVLGNELPETFQINYVDGKPKDTVFTKIDGKSIDSVLAKYNHN